ncbi:ATP-binding cassette domain-containing protein [Sporolactobacillus sp. THM7-7]|nr:ATP-binding cassette domain-containing protein [Sporolactobacillus sp. THM7-7]
MNMATQTATSIIRVQNVSKVFGSKKKQALAMRRSGRSKAETEEKIKTTVAVMDAEFDVYKGETFVLIGLSGSGKSTLLRCLNGLIKPSEGSVLLENENIGRLDRRRLQQIRRNKIGMVFQNVGLLPNRNVLDNIMFGLEVKGVEKSVREKKAKDALEMVRLNGQAYKRVDELSGGMKQRVGLARALASDQEILLMDEPFSALDPLIRREMQKLFLDIQGEVQKTVIFVTHDLDEALMLGHRAAVMKDGEIVQFGTSEDILGDPANDYVEQLVQGVDYSKIRTAKSAMKPLKAIAYQNESPQVVLRRMKANHLPAIFVMKRDGTLSGLIQLPQVTNLAEKRRQDLSAITPNPCHRVGMETPLREILPLYSDQPVPVAVVDKDHRLKGEITPVSLINSLTKEIQDYERKKSDLTEAVQE